MTPTKLALFIFALLYLLPVAIAALRHQWTGFRLTLGGYGGFTLGWVEGIELNILGAVAGIDIRRPALKLPGLGRLGLPTQG